MDYLPSNCHVYGSFYSFPQYLFNKLNFLRCLQDYGFEDVLKRKSIVAAINLQWKGGIIPSSKIPYGCVTEYTTFTQKSKQLHLQSHLDEFTSYFKSKVGLFISKNIFKIFINII